MTFISSFKCFQLLIIFVLGAITSTLANYPDSSENKKLCAQKKYAVQYIGPICVPLAEKDAWAQDSIDNCQKNLKAECPEFNEAECLWYDWVPTDPKAVGNVPFLKLPCCRLKYHATRYTWMEIYYMNQYGTSTNNSATVFDIVEIHRKIKKHAAFGHNDQPDWPASVEDPQGERGLAWKDIATPAPFPSSITSAKICDGGKDVDNVCSKGVSEYITKNYNDGFDKTKVPGKSQREIDNNANITFTNVASCTLILINKKKTDACKVIVTRQSTYSSSSTSGRTTSIGDHNITSQLCEGQIYGNGTALKIRGSFQLLWTYYPNIKERTYTIKRKPIIQRLEIESIRVVLVLSNK